MLRDLLLLLAVSCTFCTRAQNANNQQVKATEKESDSQKDYKKVGTELPPFRLFVCRDSSDDKRHEVLTNDNLPRKGNLFVMIFNPTCSHCEDETAMLEKNLDLFRKSRLVLSATPQMRPYVYDFIKMMHVNDYPMLTVGIDSANYLDKVFLYQMLPQINIYDHHHKLLKIYSGEVSIDSLKQYIE